MAEQPPPDAPPDPSPDAPPRRCAVCDADLARLSPEDADLHEVHHGVQLGFLMDWLGWG